MMVAVTTRGAYRWKNHERASGRGNEWAHVPTDDGEKGVLVAVVVKGGKKRSAAKSLGIVPRIAVADLI